MCGEGRPGTGWGCWGRAGATVRARQGWRGTWQPVGLKVGKLGHLWLGLRGDQMTHETCEPQLVHIWGLEEPRLPIRRLGDSDIESLFRSWLCGIAALAACVGASVGPSCSTSNTARC